MKHNILLVLVIIVPFIAFVGCKKKGCHNSEKAVIRDYHGLDGCGYIIELTDGTRLEPVNINDFSLGLSDGKPIWVRYHEIGAGSICMVGKTVEVECLEER
jgi:hypothetical protein